MKKILLLLLAALLFAGCETVDSLNDGKDTVKKLLEGAEWAQGRSSLIINGKKFESDALGTVCAVYSYAGIKLPEENDTLLLMLEEKKLLFSRGVPLPGDILFADGKCIGMVVRSNGKTGETVYLGADSRGYITYISTMRKIKLFGRGAGL